MIAAAPEAIGAPIDEHVEPFGDAGGDCVDRLGERRRQIFHVDAGAAVDVGRIFL